MCACLSFVHLMNLSRCDRTDKGYLPAIGSPSSLVPSPDLIIVEESTFAGGKMIIARDQLPTAPAKVDLAIPQQVRNL